MAEDYIKADRTMVACLVSGLLHRLGDMRDAAKSVGGDLSDLDVLMAALSLLCSVIKEVEDKAEVRDKAVGKAMIGTLIKNVGLEGHFTYTGD